MGYRQLRTALAAGLLAAFWALAPAGAADSVAGRVSVAGPGILTVEGKTFRLWGILMPGRGTPEGVIAYRQFGTLIDGRLLTCVPTDDVFQPVSDAICRTGQGDDIAALLVREGWALDDGPRSRGYYLDEMEDAAARRRGVWGLTPDQGVSLAAEAARPELPAIAEAPPEPAPAPAPATTTAALSPAAEAPTAGAATADTPVQEPSSAGDAAAEPPPATAWLQVAGGRSQAQMAAELARMRASYPWLLYNRDVRTLEPDTPGAGRHRALVAVPPDAVGTICQRLSDYREACLLVELP